MASRVKRVKRELLHEIKKKVREKIQGVLQSQTAALPRHKEEEETDKSKTSANRTNVRKTLH